MENFSRENVETALCIWEAMLEIRNRVPALAQAWLDLGTAQMRTLVPDIALEADEEWSEIPEDQKDSVSFDWEFCFGVVERYDWEQHCHLPAIVRG